MNAKIIVTSVIAAASTSIAANVVTDFESFTAGSSVNTQGGWQATATRDEAIVDLGGNKVWRMSNAITSGSFGDQPHSPGTGYYSGETAATYQPNSAQATSSRFYGAFSFRSVSTVATTGLFLSISPDDGNGSRLSYLSLSDTGSGITVGFYDTQDNHPVTNRNEGFVYTPIATNLAYGTWNKLAFDIEFADGRNVDGVTGNVNGNDVVKIYLNDALVHTGTSWESYFWTTNEGPTQTVRAIDRLLFRAGGTAAPAATGGGFYFDNVEVGIVPEPASLGLLGVVGMVIGRRRRV